MQYLVYSAILSVWLIGQKDCQLAPKRKYYEISRYIGEHFNPKNPRYCHETPPPECLMPKDEGTCFLKYSRYYYDPESNKCIRFTYKGCGKSKNSFWDLNECMASCYVSDEGCREEPPEQCLLPVNVGFCTSRMIKYRYDAASNRCVTFVYTGCGGNTNNYWSIGDCYLECAVP